jgi:hypothetical protein
MPKRPKYAEGVGGKLIRVFCKGACRKTTVHRLDRNAQEVTNPNERYAGCLAHCLVCGKVASDNYNWHGDA